MSDEVVQGREPARPPSGAGRHRRTLLTTGAVVAVLVLVALVGTHRRTPTPAPSATPRATASSAPASGPALALTATRCAGLVGGRLTVGFGVTNQGPAPLQVLELEPAFPIGGLHTAPADLPDRTVCPRAVVSIPATVAPGAETVLAFVLTPDKPRCVDPLPVDVGVTYRTAAQAPVDADLHPFPDLGGFGLPGSC